MSISIYNTLNWFELYTINLSCYQNIVSESGVDSCSYKQMIFLLRLPLVISGFFLPWISWLLFTFCSKYIEYCLPNSHLFGVSDMCLDSLYLYILVFTTFYFTLSMKLQTEKISWLSSPWRSILWFIRICCVLSLNYLCQLLHTKHIKQMGIRSNVAFCEIYAY